MIDQKEGETEISVKIHYDDMVSVIITLTVQNKQFLSCHFMSAAAAAAADGFHLHCYYISFHYQHLNYKFYFLTTALPSCAG
jgi:hypothetical protein